MTISSTSNKASYTGAGSTGPYAIPFYIIATDDVKAIRRSVVAVESTLSEGTDYTVSAAATSAATLTLASTAVAPQTGETLLIKRVEQLTQPTDLPTAGAFPAATVEEMADRLTTICQQLDEAASRAITFAQTSPASGIAFPDPSASKYIRWNAGGTALENVALAVASTSITISGLGEQLVQAASASSARSLLGAISSTEETPSLGTSTAVTAANQVAVYSSTAGTAVRPTGVTVSTADQMAGHYAGVVTRSASFTLGSSEAGKVVLCNSTATTLAAGYQAVFQRLSTNTVTFAASTAGPDSLQSRGSKDKLGTQYGMASLIKTAAASSSTGNWGLEGDIST